MPDAAQLIYSDACVFLSYINETPGRMETLDALLDEVEKSDGRKRIVTSVLSKVEVAYATHERSAQVAIEPIPMWRQAA